MNTIENHGLSQNELATMLKILAPFSERIDSVGVFGSRATGQFTDISDIDLVLYGSLSPQETARLNTLFDESNLGLRVEIKSYSEIKFPPLIRHIDSCVKTLFTKEQLSSSKG